jgi:surfeit locus 1 family protein
VKRKDVAFLVLGSIFALVCIRLGFWQLSRLAERKAFNRELLSRAETPPVALRDLPRDTGAAHFRRVKISGDYDYAHEIILVERTRDGSPGVNILTPLRMPGTDTAILVNRGWVYSPDAMTVDLSRWREAPSMSGEAYVQNYSARPGVPKSKSHPNAFRWADKTAISQAIPYPIAPWYVVLIGGRTPANVPPRIEVPPLDEGPHQSYAIQWFSFATIAIVGMFLYARRK